MTSTTFPATARQLSYLRGLASERPMWAQVENLHPDVIDGLSKTDCSMWIDAALSTPREDAPAPAESAAAPASPACDVKHGSVYVNGTGQYVKVQKSGRSGNLYGKVWDGVEWIYEGTAAVRAIVRTISAEEAAAFGHSVSRCIFCMLKLDDDKEGRSIEVGYGPVCAKKHGLPWGATQVAAARQAGQGELLDTLGEQARELVF